MVGLEPDFKVPIFDFFVVAFVLGSSCISRYTIALRAKAPRKNSKIGTFKTGS